MRYQMLTVAIFLCAFLLATSCSDSSKSDNSSTDSGNAPTPESVQSLPSASLGLQVGDKAGDFMLTTLEGKQVQLSKQLAHGPVVLVVLRGWPGYQCPICTVQVGQFIGRAEDLKAAGAHVVLVYPGPAEQLMDHAQEFVSGKDIPLNFSFVIDPDLKFTLSYGLRWDAPKETAYPSTFVIDPQAVVRFAKVSKTHGDRASVEEVLKALAEIRE